MIEPSSRADPSLLLAATRRELDREIHRRRWLGWRLESIHATRSWRLAAVVRGLARRPRWRRVARLPRDLLRALRGRPRPDPPLRIERQPVQSVQSVRSVRSVQSVQSVRSAPSVRSEPAERTEVGARPADIRAAVVAPDELAARLGPEWRQVRLTPGTWRAALDRPLDLVLVAAWWDELPDVIAACRRAGVPCVLWAWDSTDYSAIVEHVAHVFVASEDLLRRYRRTSRDPARVSLLRPAVQPRLHRPTPEHWDRPAEVACLDGVPVDGLPSSSLDPRTGVVAVARDDSPAVLQRALECAATGRPVVTRATGGLARVLGGAAVSCDGDRAVTTHLVNLLANVQLRERWGHRAARTVLASETYAHRVDEILRRVGLGPVDRTRSATVLLATKRPDQVARAIDEVALQRHRPLQLVLVLHGAGFDAELARKQACASGLDDVVVLEAEESLSLGACLNRAIDAADGDYLAKMDDDDLYGEHHLSDLLAAFDYTAAGVVGRGAHYAHFVDTGATVLRHPDAEHQYTHHVHGGTIVAAAEVMRRIRFADRSVGEDTAFLAACTADGVPIYSADRFSYVWMRQADTSRHSWRRTEAELLAKGRLEFYGRPELHVLI